MRWVFEEKTCFNRESWASFAFSIAIYGEIIMKIHEGKEVFHCSSLSKVCLNLTCTEKSVSWIVRFKKLSSIQTRLSFILSLPESTVSNSSFSNFFHLLFHQHRTCLEISETSKTKFTGRKNFSDFIRDKVSFSRKFQSKNKSRSVGRNTHNYNKAIINHPQRKYYVRWRLFKTKTWLSID